MCLILIAWKSHPAYRLIIAANRDEYYDRPTAPAAFWEDAPGLLAGRDLRAHGTWLGITVTGKTAALTNYRDPASNMPHVPTRGRLVPGYLSGRENPPDYLNRLAPEAGDYNGFNLIVGEKDDLYWYSNRGNRIQKLRPGIHGLSNHLLNTPWPKVTRGKEMFGGQLAAQKDADPETLFAILADRRVSDDGDLPDTGVGLKWERRLSPIFITSPEYGTRSSTLLFIDLKGHVTFIERDFHPRTGRSTTNKHEFRIEP